MRGRDLSAGSGGSSPGTWRRWQNPARAIRVTLGLRPAQRLPVAVAEARRRLLLSTFPFVTSLLGAPNLVEPPGFDITAGKDAEEPRSHVRLLELLVADASPLDMAGALGLLTESGLAAEF